MAAAITRHHQLKHFRGGQDKHSAFHNMGRPMKAFPFIQLNHPDHLNFLVVDVDHDDAYIRLLHPAVPEPHWIIENPETGHAQAGWLIDTVYRGSGAATHPARYAEAVQTALDNLVGGDPAFTRFLVRNPAAHSPAGTVHFGKKTEPYKLGDLMKHMKEYIDPFEAGFNAWNPHTHIFSGRRESPQEQANESGRNNALFNATRNALWSASHVSASPEAYEFAQTFAFERNAQLAAPLPRKEVQELAASAVRQVAKGHGRRTRLAPGQRDPWLVRLGRMGGSKSTDDKKAAARENARKATKVRQNAAQEHAETAVEMRRAGRTVAEIAGVLKRAVRTVQRYLSGSQGVAGNDDITQPTGGVVATAATRAECPSTTATSEQADTALPSPTKHPTTSRLDHSPAFRGPKCKPWFIPGSLSIRDDHLIGFRRLFVHADQHDVDVPTRCLPESGTDPESSA